MAARRGDREEDDDRTGEDDGGDRAQKTGPRQLKKQQRLGRVPQEGRTGGEWQYERGVERREHRGFGQIRDGGGTLLLSD